MAGLFELVGMDWLVEFYARYPQISLDFTCAEGVGPG